MRLRFKVVCFAVAALGCYGLWLGLVRKLPVFAVQSVTVTGLHGDTAPQITAALVTTAREMTTTDVSVAQLRASVAAYTIVGGLRVRTQFPHAMTIDVVEREPVARLDDDGVVDAVAKDGTVLAGIVPSRQLPLVRAIQAPIGGRVHEWQTLTELRIAGDVPAALRTRVASVLRGSDGFTVILHSGPLLYFGDGTLPHAKWDAAAAVLANPTSRGARYIDVSLPSRPAAQVGDPSTAAGSTGASGSVVSVATLVSGAG
jgi:cell division protein FtsQ